MARLASAHEPVHGRPGFPLQAVGRPSSQRLGQTERKESTQPNRRLIRVAALVPSVPEIRYLLARLLIRPSTRKPFILAWSLWRRRHQAAATLSHYKRYDPQL